MLTLRRKKGEAIVINGDITLVVRDIGADSVKLTIDAPKTVAVMRKELIEATEENIAAASSHGSPAKLAALIHDGKAREKK